jgi:hypothetical protein
MVLFCGMGSSCSALHFSSRTYTFMLYHISNKPPWLTYALLERTYFKFQFLAVLMSYSILHVWSLDEAGEMWFVVGTFLSEGWQGV